MKDLRTLLQMSFTEMTVDERLAAVRDRLENYSFHREWLRDHQQFDKRSSEYRWHREKMTESYEKMRDWFASVGLEINPMPKI